MEGSNGKGCPRASSNRRDERLLTMRVRGWRELPFPTGSGPPEALLLPGERRDRLAE